MSSIIEKITKSRHRNSLRYGVPFLLCIVAGSFGLQQFTQLRYTFSKKQPVTPEEMEKFGVAMKNPTDVTLESEYEKIKEIDIDNWENVRGPRPWEEKEAANK